MLGLPFVVAPAASFHHHHHHHESMSLSSDPISGPSTGPAAATALGMGVGVGVIPLLTATPCLAPQNMDDQDLFSSRNKAAAVSGSGGLQFWQNQSFQLNTNNNNNNPRRIANIVTTSSVLDSHNTCTAGGGGGGGNSGSSSGTMTCQDCGNQAKKDCSHRRCRTCCRSRGFDCSTHVKSTWVSAARRRDRQLMVAAAGGCGAGSSNSANSGVKKPRLSQTTTTNSHTSTSNTTPPRSFDTSSSPQDASFKAALPGEVRAPAVFKCVRVTSVDDGEAEYAYQAMVKIGGHVFKGLLYNQGIEATNKDAFPNLSKLHLAGGGVSPSSPVMDPPHVYAASAAGFVGGPTYGSGSQMN